MSFTPRPGPRIGIKQTEMVEIRELLEKYPDFGVLVIGDLMADRYIWGTPSRLSHEAPVPILKVVGEEYKLGGAANVANNLRALEAKVFLSGIVGYDDAAHWFQKECSAAGMDTGGIFPSENRPTTRKVRIMSTGRNRQMLRYDQESSDAITEKEAASIFKYTESHLEVVQAIVLADYDKGIFSNPDVARHILDLANRHGKLTVVESKPRHADFFVNPTLVAFDYDQSQEFIFRRVNSLMTDGASIAYKVNELLGAKGVIMIKGEEEICLYTAEQQAFEFLIPREAIVDSTGMKDTLIGVLTLSLLGGADFATAVRIANRAVLCKIGKVGTATVALQELLAAGI